jgi:predicted AAA+ superfamily ATPase
VARLRVDELGLIEKMVRFVGRAEVDGINYSSFSKNIGITNYKAEMYVEMLSKAFVLQAVFPKGANVMKQPKVLL